MNGRRQFVCSVAAIIPTLAHSAQAEADKALPLLVILTFATTSQGSTMLQAFDAGFTSIGWVAGRNVRVVRCFADGSVQRLRELAAEIVTMNPNVVWAPQEISVRTLRELTKTIPIVTSPATDPVGLGWAATLGRPGGNVTGLAWDQDIRVNEKYAQFMKEMLPSLTRIGCLLDSQISQILKYHAAFEQAASKLGVTVTHRELQSAAAISQAIESLAADGAQALMVYGSPTTFIHAERISKLSATLRLPDMHIFRHSVEQGGLMSYGPSLTDMYRRAAAYVDKIIKGAKPGDLPFELPTKYELLINKKAADRLGLRIPKTLLALADEII